MLSHNMLTIYSVYNIFKAEGYFSSWDFIFELRIFERRISLFARKRIVIINVITNTEFAIVRIVPKFQYLLRRNIDDRRWMLLAKNFSRWPVNNYENQTPQSNLIASISPLDGGQSNLESHYYRQYRCTVIHSRTDL